MHYTMIVHFLLGRPISRVLVPFSSTSWLSVKLRHRVGTLTILPQISTTVLAIVQATVQALLDMVVVYNQRPARMTWSHKKLQVCYLKPLCLPWFCRNKSTTVKWGYFGHTLFLIKDIDFETKRTMTRPSIYGYNEMLALRFLKSLFPHRKKCVFEVTLIYGMRIVGLPTRPDQIIEADRFYAGHELMLMSQF